MFLSDRLQFGFSRCLPMHLQSEAAECGLACLSMVVAHHGLETDLTALRRQFPLSLKGATLGQLIDVAAKLDFVARPLRLDIEELSELRLPCVLHWDMNHFVVLKRVDARGVVIHDPALGVRRLSMNEVSEAFTGVALELTPAPLFKPRRVAAGVRLRDLMGRVVGLKRSLTQVFLLAIALEAFAMVSPFFNQWVVDQALLTGDRNLLYTLALGFGLLVVTQCVLEAVRGWVVTVMSTSINIQWLGNVFQHLVRLPAAYFEKRHMGDVVNRFRSIDAIQSTLTTGFVEVLIDGLMAIGTLTMMLLYSPKLAAISMVALLIYIALRVSLYATLHSANQSELVHAARQQTMFMETVRGIQSIKVFNRADRRTAQWLNVVVDQKNCGLRTQRLMLVFKTAQQLVFGLDAIVIMLCGALLVLDRTFSVGMLMAFIAYKSQFSTRLSHLVDKLFELKMLELHGARLADIVLAERERDDPPTVSLSAPIEPSLSISGLRFKYSAVDAPVLDGIDLEVRAGESVAIVGASGCGKTTLLKVLLGLYRPTAGEISVGQVPLKQLGMSAYRDMVAAVMQDDQLFAGSIADNIAFFAEAPDRQWIEACAKQAAIHDDILAMPMGYKTLVGDMGSALSAGQKQRVLLARALYRRPSILVMDEATSHLDVANERAVSQAISNLRLTRIIVAHRPETIRSADRVVELRAGRVASTHVNQPIEPALAA